MDHADEMRDEVFDGASVVDRSKSYREFREMITLHLGVSESEVVPDARFVDLGADSLTSLELTVAVGDTFGIRITDEEVAAISTVGEAWSLIKSRIG